VVQGGRLHLAFELLVENDGDDPIQLRSLRFDAASFGAGTYAGKELSDRIKLLSAVDADTLPDLRKGLGAPKAPAPDVVPAHATAAIFLWLSAERTAGIPPRIPHVLSFTSATRSEPRTLEVSVSPAPSESLVLEAPLRGDGWIAFQGPENASPHRRTVPRMHGRYRVAQRFAIDWGRTGSAGRLVRAGTSGSKSADYVGYGEPVFAVSDARVVHVNDGVADNDGDKGAVAPVTVDTASGNTVILDLGHDRYALYAHLQPKSIKVRPGQMVKRGQLIGALGNSGNSSAPHLHFHVCDAPSALDCDGVPFAFATFDHQPMTMAGDSNAEAHAVTSGDRTRVAAELPPTDELIGFPKPLPR
jgi:hypothetical protein